MDGKKIIAEYASWIKNNSYVRDVDDGKYCAISTPFLDRHNDHIDIYITKTETGGYLLSDDGDTISDLIITGTFPNTPKRKQILEMTLRGFGVSMEADTLFIEASHTSELPKKKHALIQAILAVNDLYVMSQENTTSFFKEDVTTFLNARNISYVSDVKISGKTGYDHTIDFIIPGSPNRSEQLIKTINRATKDQIMAIVFAFSDIAAIRKNNSEHVVIYNDENDTIPSDAAGALTRYNIRYVAWSERNIYTQDLLAS